MSHSERSEASSRRTTKRPVIATEKNVGNGIEDNGMSRNVAVSDQHPHSREFFESRPNNLEFYDWQPSTPMLENNTKTKKRNEDREPFQKWQRTQKNSSSPETAPDIGARKKINYQMRSNQPPRVDELLEELSRLQNSLSQASSLLDKIMMLPEPQRSEQRACVVSIIRQLKEEEQGYKALLHGIQAAEEVDESLQNNAAATNYSRTCDFGQTFNGGDSFGAGDNISKPNNCYNSLPSSFPIMASVTPNSQNAVTGIGRAEDEGSTVADSEVSVASLQRHRLQRKLQNLQEKKQQMDELLEKLQNLKTDQEFLDDGAMSHTISRNQKASLSADRTVTEAEQMLNKMETRRKLKKLKMMRDQLQQLKELEQFYRRESNDQASNEGGSETGLLPDDDRDDDDGGGDDDDDEEANADEGRESEVFDHLLSLLRSQPESVLANDGQENASCSSANAIEKGKGKAESSSQSRDFPRNGSFGEVSDMRQLEAASEKLLQLQQLVALVQQTGGHAMAGKPVFEAGDIAQDDQVDHKPVDDSVHVNDREEEEFYEQKMREQQMELEKLMQEREKLLKLRADLDRIAQDNRNSIPGESVLNGGLRSNESSTRILHPLDGSWVSRNLRSSTERKAADQRAAEALVQETAQVTFQEPLESVVSNEEVYDQMLWQRLMREEMREKKKDLRGFAQKRSSSNVNGLSEGVTTHRSDNFRWARTSPSEDVTMATWGGSTAGNLESTEENENRSNNDVGLEANSNTSKIVYDDDDNDDDDDENVDDGSDEDEDENAEDETEEEEDEDDDGVDNEDNNDNNIDSDDTAPTYDRKFFHEGNSTRRKQDYDNTDYCDNHGHKEKMQNHTLSAVQQSIHSLRRHVADLTATLKRSMRDSRQENIGSSLDQTTQLQQNQLFLSLNQSYFQLVASQNDLLERFNHLEQFVLRFQNDMHLSNEPNSDFDQNLNPHPVVDWKESCRQASDYQQPVAGGSFGGSELSGSNLISGQRASSQLLECSSNNKGVESTRCLRQQLVTERAKYELLPQEEASARNSAILRTTKSLCCDEAADVVVRQQNLSKARAFAMEHMASQKVIEDVKSDRRFPRSLPDDASASSVSGSCSEPVGRPAEGKTKEEPSGSNITSGFERLSDEIYSEVASLISQNEQCPEFLVQLFHKLQFLSTDFLRQRALYALQNLISHSSVESDQPHFAVGDSQKRPMLGAEEKSQFKRPQDREESIGISSEQSTPSPCSNSQWDNPFERDILGETVIHFDEMLRPGKGMESRTTELVNPAAGHSMEKNVPSNSDRSAHYLSASHSETRAESSQCSAKGESDGSVSDELCPHIDAHQLDQQIKEIMLEVIPVVKEHIGGVFSQHLLQYVEDLVLSRVRQSECSRPEFVQFFSQQLATVLKDSLIKFEGRKILDCGEDLLVDLSEILFNELAFFRLMQNLNHAKSKVKAKFLNWRHAFQPSACSGFIKKNQKAEINMSDSSSDSDHLTESDLELLDSAKKLDKAKLHGNAGDGEIRWKKNEQKLPKACDAESTGGEDFLEEDEYYTEDMKFLNYAESIDDSFSLEDKFCDSNVKIELAPSETKPFTRIGSDEDDEAADEAASADDPYETAVSRDARKEESISTTNSSASLEHESCCERSGEKEEKEEKEKDTSMLEFTAGEDVDTASSVVKYPVEDEQNETPDNDQVEFTEASHTSYQTAPGSVELDDNI